MNELHHSATRPTTAVPTDQQAAKSGSRNAGTAPQMPLYVVQLAVYAGALDPMTIPHVDLFDVYHLYSQCGVANGVVSHALRLGFFKEARTARTVARYLASYFDSPTIVQVGASDQARALKHQLVARKDIGASGRHAVIELSAPPPVPVETRAATAYHQAHASASRPSVWSRLLGSLRR